MRTPRGVRTAIALVRREGGPLNGAMRTKREFSRRGGTLTVRMQDVEDASRITAVIANADGRRKHGSGRLRATTSGSASACAERLTARQALLERDDPLAGGAQTVLVELARLGGAGQRRRNANCVPGSEQQHVDAGGGGARGASRPGYSAAIAGASRSSLIVTPAKPISARNRSVATAGRGPPARAPRAG